MENAQEAIEEYEQKTNHIRRVESKAPPSPVTMILDHEYDNHGMAKYLCQAEDGRQKWKAGPREYNARWDELVREYWNNAEDDKDPLTWDDPDAYL